MIKLFFDPSPHSPNVKIINLIKPNSTVLDIGCASGYLAKELNKKNCHTYGIEINPIDAKKAKKHCLRVICHNLETINTSTFPKKYFDYLIYGDILEHLQNPAMVLTKLSPWLKKTGWLIASIPNVARAEIRLKLLLGHFDYQESGILSKHHLHFYTLSSAQNLLKQAGYQVKNILYTGLGSRIKILPRLLAFQFIFVAQKQ